MTRGAARHPVTLALWRCVAVAGWPTLAAAAVAFLFARLSAPMVEPGAATATQSPWLLLPLLTATGCCTGAAIRLWPLFAAQQPGADWLWRWQRGPLRGVGAVIAGALLAQFALTLPLTTVFALALGAPTEARVVLRPRLPELPVLQAPGQRLVASLPGDVALSELRLRPRAGLPGSPFAASVLELRLDGELQAGALPGFEQDHQLVVVPLPSRAVAEFELRLTAGSVPLWFDAGSLECIAAAPRSTLANGVSTALLALLPTLLALALAALAGAASTTPTVALVAGSCLFVTTIGAIGPLDPAIDALLRGRWIVGSGTFGAAVPFLAAACMAMIGRMLLQGQRR